MTVMICASLALGGSVNTPDALMLPSAGTSSHVTACDGELLPMTVAENVVEPVEVAGEIETSVTDDGLCAEYE